MQRWLKTLPPLAVNVVAIASFALSYVALRDVSAEVGAVPAAMAWLVPIVIDGGVIGGSAVIWAQASDGAKRQIFPFVFVGALVVVSVIVNVNHAADTMLAKSIAALPPLVLLGSLELAAGQLKRSRALADEAGEAERERDQAMASARERAEQAEAGAADQTAAADEARQLLEDARQQLDRLAEQARADREQMVEEAEQARAEHQRALEETARQRQADADRHQDELAAVRDTVDVTPAATDGDAESGGGGRVRELAHAGGRTNGHRRTAAAASPVGSGAAQPPAAPTPAPRAQRTAEVTDSPAAATGATGSPMLQAALDAVDGVADLPVRDAAEQVFDRFVATGGDPMDRTLAADLALALGSTPGYIRNVLRDRRSA